MKYAKIVREKFKKLVLEETRKLAQKIDHSSQPKLGKTERGTKYQEWWYFEQNTAGDSQGTETGSIG